MRGIQIALKRACLPCLEDEDEDEGSVNFASVVVACVVVFVDLRLASELEDGNLSDRRTTEDSALMMVALSPRKLGLIRLCVSLSLSVSLSRLGFLEFHLSSSLAYISTLTALAPGDSGWVVRKATTGWSGVVDLVRTNREHCPGPIWLPARSLHAYRPPPPRGRGRARRTGRETGCA